MKRINSTPLFNKLHNKTQKARRDLIINPIFQGLITGQITRDAYSYFLRETFHFSRHTSRFLAAAASRVVDEKERIRSRFLRHAVEEDGHHLFALKDLKNLGYSEDFINSEPLAGTTAIISYHYYLANYGNPVGIMGAVVVFEGLAHDFAGKASELLKKKLALPSSAVTFLHSHGHFDRDHIEEAKKVINEEINDDRDSEDIIEVAEKMYKFYRWTFEEIEVLTSSRLDDGEFAKGRNKTPEVLS